MFSDCSFEPTGFNSQVSTEKSQKTINTQTETIVYEAKGTQKMKQRTAGTQTAEAVKPMFDVNYEKLASFLNRVTPLVIKVLDEAYENNAFEGYNPEKSDEPPAHIEMISCHRINGESDTDQKISCVSWNVAGDVLAVGRSVIYHETWCDHLSEIKFFKLSRQEDVAETADMTLETQACITALSYHPTDRSILAAALFNGDVLLCNIDDDDSVNSSQIYVHDDTVTSLLWSPKTLTEQICLVTTSADGYILFYKMSSNQFTSGTVCKRFKIAKEYNPAENSRPRSARGRKERAIEAGLSITCMDFSPLNPATFIVGTLCGGLYKCNVNKAVPIDLDDESDETSLKDPVVYEYKRIEGSVTSLKCSPVQNSFILSGTDKTIKFYDMDNCEAVDTIKVKNTIIGLCWYHGGRRIGVAAYGAEPVVNFYNSANRSIVLNLKFESTRENTSCMDFNLKRDVAAIGDTSGRLEIWKTPKQAIPDFREL